MWRNPDAHCRPLQIDYYTDELLFVKYIWRRCLHVGGSRLSVAAARLAFFRVNRVIDTFTRIASQNQG